MRRVWVVSLLLLLSCVELKAADQPTISGEIVAKIINREHQVVEILQGYTPIVETYIQNMRLQNGKRVPKGDHYFLSVADLTDPVEAQEFRKKKRDLLKPLTDEFRYSFSPEPLPDGFLQMVYLDTSGFDRDHYRFEYVRREFLGEVRCLVFDLTPLPKSGKGRFSGRIWVEDQDYTIVRFNGIYTGRAAWSFYFHMDSWRLNVGSGLWLPALIFVEETDFRCCGIWKWRRHIRLKAQTRLWGYNLKYPNIEEELTKITVDPSAGARDLTQGANDLSPIQMQHAWEQESENNVMERLERLGLLAPAGDLDKILATVINNLELTNNLDIRPEVRCRILLTSNLEAFAVGHTIILSRGLIDVLPDEATLASILAHCLAHLVLDQRLDTKYAFSDNVLFEQRDAFRRLSVARSYKEEKSASHRADELLKNSPYAQSIQSSQEFFQEVQSHSPAIHSLLQPHFGRCLEAIATFQAKGNSTVGKRDATRVRALPLGARTQVDPWTNRVEMIKSTAFGTVAERDNMPFEVTPFILYLKRRATSSVQSSILPAKQSENAQKPQ